MNNPLIIEKIGRSSSTFDLPTKLLQQRIIYLGEEVDDYLANSIVMQLLWLNSDDNEADISMYINTPGGSITAGLAIFDTMNWISNKVHTIAIGEASSMGAFLLSQGTGTRKSFKSSRIMIHQPLGGAIGQASDIEIHYKEIQRFKHNLAEKMAIKSGKRSTDEFLKLMDRDYFMSPEEALELGIIDEIV